MIFSLDILQARKGDCSILHYGSKGDLGLAIIDGGPSRVYKSRLKPRLAQIRKAHGLEKDESLRVNLIMVSHIDDDHIHGILELTNELVVARDSQQPLPLKVLSFWHNSFDDIIGNKPDELLAAVTASFGVASLSGEPDIEGIDPGTVSVLASVGQGFRLRDDVRKLKLRINPEFEGKLIMATDNGAGLDLDKDLRLIVIGPMQAELVALQKDHDKFLKKSKDEKETEAALASFTDTSVANLSSLVVIAEVTEGEKTKRILFTGDARGDKILQGLEMVNAFDDNGKLHVDILKMPHHGSDRNIDPIFFQRLSADHYVFSGNGENGNPERNTLQMLLNERGDEEFTVHLTYPISEIDVEREKDWNKEQQKERTRKKKNPQVIVRDDWSPNKHSLTSFFAANEDFNSKVTIVEEGKQHVINLLEELGF